MSDEIPKEKFETITSDGANGAEPPMPEIPSISEQNLALMKTVSEIATLMKEQSDRITKLEGMLSGPHLDMWLKDSLTGLVGNIQKRFEANETRLAQIVQAPQGQSGGGLWDVIAKFADKINIAPKPASNFAAEAQGMFEDIIKLDLKEMLKGRRALMGLPEPPQHVVLESS